MSSTKSIVRRLLFTLVIFFILHALARNVDIVYGHVLSHLSFFFLSVWAAWLLSSVIIQSKCIDTCDKAVLITGCDTGFGNSLALQLEEIGFLVFAGCLFPEGNGAQHLIAKASRNIRVISLDVTKEQSVDEAVTEVEKQLKTDKRELWGVVNNAGIGHYSGIDWSSPGVDVYSSQIDVNTLGTVRVTKSFLPLLRRTNDSRIVVVASMASRLVFPGLTGYSMSKYAVRAFGDGLRREQRSYGVNVSIIEPAMYNTSMTDTECCLNNLKSHWNQTPENVKESIGKNKFESLYETVHSFLLMKRNNVQEVLDAMIDSLMSEEPKCFYRVGGLKEKMAMYSLLVLPEELQDFFVESSAYDYILKIIQSKRNANEG